METEKLSQLINYFEDGMVDYEVLIPLAIHDFKFMMNKDTLLNAEIKDVIRQFILTPDQGAQYIKNLNMLALSHPDSWIDYSNDTLEFYKAFFQNLYYDLFRQHADFNIDLVKDTKSYRLKSLLVKEGVFPESILYPENN